MAIRLNGFRGVGTAGSVGPQGPPGPQGPQGPAGPAVGGPGLLFAEQFSGTTAGARISAAIAALPATGGVVDASGLAGDQTISSDIFAGVTKPGELRLGASTFHMTVPLQVPSNWTIRGAGCATQFSAAADLPHLSELVGSASAVIYVKANQSSVTIRDLCVKGPYVSGPSGTTFGIYVSQGTVNCQVLNCKVYN